MPEEMKPEKSRADFIAEKIAEKLDTPLEVFLFSLLVLGILSFAASTLVNNCGNVSDIADFPDGRENTFVRGGVVVFNNNTLVDNVLVGSGNCAVIEQVDGGIIKVNVLAKPTPNTSLGEDGTYQPSDSLRVLLSNPVEGFLFFFRSNPVGEINSALVTPLPTRPFTNLVRYFYLEIAIWIILILVIFTLILYKIRKKYMTRKDEFWRVHKLRTHYQERLFPYKSEVREIESKFNEIFEGVEEAENQEEFKAAVLASDVLVERVMNLIDEFEGDTLTQMLQSSDKETIPKINKLWEAHILASEYKKENNEVAIIKKQFEIYMNTFKYNLTIFSVLDY